MYKGIGESVMIVMAGFGLYIEDQVETPDRLTIYVSVPETSYKTNVSGEQMAGMKLAKEYKNTLSDLGLKRLTVKAKIRKGEHWTKDMAEAAEIRMKQTIYGSQW